MKCDQMKFLFHTSSISVAVPGSHWTKKSSIEDMASSLCTFQFMINIYIYIYIKKERKKERIDSSFSTTQKIRWNFNFFFPGKTRMNIVSGQKKVGHVAKRIRIVSTTQQKTSLFHFKSTVLCRYIKSRHLSDVKRSLSQPHDIKFAVVMSK